MMESEDDSNILIDLDNSKSIKELGVYIDTNFMSSTIYTLIDLS